jgi:hypothetical protein
LCTRRYLPPHLSPVLATAVRCTSCAHMQALRALLPSDDPLTLDAEVKHSKA